MYLCLRVDLDYVPWDSPDAAEFGHGEPAAFLRLLDLGRHTGFKFHFFVSERVLRAFPATAEAVLNDGHDLDWLCKHPEEGADRLTDAKQRLAVLGHSPIGFALREAWPNEVEPFQGLTEMAFMSAKPGGTIPGVPFFPVETRSSREAVRAGISARMWTDANKAQLREAASRNVGITLCVRPQVLARLDPKLNHVQEILEMARAVDMPIRTLRDLIARPT